MNSIMMYIEIINTFIRYIGFIVEYIGLGIVAVSAFIALKKLSLKEATLEHIRKHLAKRMIFGLEFIIAADIVLATVETDITQSARLGGIVLIRVILGWALHKEAGLKLK